jgi:transcriptional regulator with XRE-family HTH domain
MTAKQFSAALERLGLSHRTAARVLGIGRNTVIRYAHDHTPVAPCVARLIAMLEKHGIPEAYQ